jgi:hypothetical protein
MSASAAPSSVTAETVGTFDVPNMTFSVHMAADTAAGTDQGIGTIKLLDFLSATVASASWNEATNLLTLTILGATDVSIASPASDLLFHRLVFKIAGGTATWSIDNGAPLLTQGGFAPGPLTLELGATYAGGTAWALFYFDNVHVTSP